MGMVWRATDRTTSSRGCSHWFFVFRVAWVVYFLVDGASKCIQVYPFLLHHATLALKGLSREVTCTES